MASILGLDHVSIIVRNAEASMHFYSELLGIGLLERPDLGFPGYWMDLTQGQSLHIMQLTNPNEGVNRPQHGGRDFHFALRVNSIDAYIEKLELMQVPYIMSKSGRKALFVKDLDNNAFELFEYSSSN